MKREAAPRLYPIAHSCFCRSRRLGPSRPSFIGEVSVTTARHSPRSDSIQLPARAGTLPLRRRYVQNKKKSRTKQVRTQSLSLSTIRRNVAGLGIASEEHWVCAPTEDGATNVRAFGTKTPQLEALVDWLTALHIESVAMESTSVYWIPLY